MIGSQDVQHSNTTSQVNFTPQFIHDQPINRTTTLTDQGRGVVARINQQNIGMVRFDRATKQKKIAICRVCLFVCFVLFFFQNTLYCC